MSEKIMIIEVAVCIDLTDAVAISVYVPAELSDKAALVEIDTPGRMVVGHVDQLGYEKIGAFVLDNGWSVGWCATERTVSND